VVENIQKSTPQYKIHDVFDDVKLPIKTKSENTISSESHNYKLSDIKTTLKLADLQKIASNLKILTTNKVKHQLIDEIKTKLTKK
jgi:hypothetical protein